MDQERRGGRWWRVWPLAWPFAALCVLVSNRWLIENALPQAQSSYLSEAVGCLLASACMLAWRLLGAKTAQGQYPGQWLSAVAGGLVIAGSALAASVASRYVEAGSATLAMALTPVVIAVAVSAAGRSDGELVARLWPGLAGLAALLLLLPQPDLSGWRFDLALAGMPLVVGTSAVAAAGGARVEVAGPYPRRQANLLGTQLLVGALFFGVLAFSSSIQGNRSSIRFPAVALDGVTAALTLVVLRRLGPIRWAAQYLTIPLVTLIVGVALLRPALDWRSWLAFGLLVLSSGYLLFSPARAEEGSEELSLRG